MLPFSIPFIIDRVFIFLTSTRLTNHINCSGCWSGGRVPLAGSAVLSSLHRRLEWREASEGRRGLEGGVRCHQAGTGVGTHRGGVLQ